MPLLSSALLLRSHALSLLTISYYLLTSPYQVLSCTPIWLIGESMSIKLASYAPEHASVPAGGARPGSVPADKDFRAPSLLQPLARSVQSGQGTESERELFALLAIVLLVYALMVFLFAGDLTMIFASSSRSSKSDGSSGGAQSTSSSSRFGEELHTLLSAQSRWLSLAGLHVLGSAVFVFWIYAFHSHSSSASEPSLFPGLARLVNRVAFTAGLADMLFWGYLWTVLKDEGREVGKMLARRRQIEEEDE